MQLFSNIIGNGLAKRSLISMIEKGAVHHAMIFSGPPGIGKKLFALDLAKGILGMHHSRKIDASNHPDVKVFSPEGKSGIHTIASIQQIQAQMALEPFEATSRVFIIEDADRMQPVVSNSLLKTLEEPPERNYFILLSSQSDDIIETIHSRSRMVPFLPIPEKEIFQYVKMKCPDRADVDLKKAAFLSHGSLNRALELLKNPDDVKRGLLMDLLTLGRMSPSDMSAHLIKIEQALTDGENEESSPLLFYTEFDRLLSYVLYWYRDLHLLSDGISVEFVFHFDMLDVLKAQDKSRLPPMEDVFLWVEECRLAVHRSIKVKTALEYLFSQCFA